ncbi:hypothetical protein, partial [Saccharopolyspora kobensis]
VGASDPVWVAAGRVLGADLLAPSTLLGRPPSGSGVELLGEAVRAFPPAAGSVCSGWTHWGARAALQHAMGDHRRGAGGEPEVNWVAARPWAQLAHELAQLAMLAGFPASALTAAVADRVEDVARGFVRAVRRRDWPQAAGVGRWLAAVAGVPDSLGLDAGVEFVGLMGAGDARVALHVRAAQILRRGVAR